MTDPSPHAEVLLVPGVDRVYPPRHTPAVLVRTVSGVTEVGIGVTLERPVPETALAALAELRRASPDAARIRLRIASIA